MLKKKHTKYMKTILLLLFFIGAFLVMDASHREALSVAVRDAEARGRGDTRYRLPRGDEIIDLQFSHRAQEFGSIFDSSGPWAYRSDVAVPAAKKGGASGASAGAASGAASEAAAGAASGAAAEAAAAKPAKDVEGFSGTGGGRPSFIDSFGSPTHPTGAGAGAGAAPSGKLPPASKKAMRSALAGLPEVDWSSTRFGRANRAASTSDYSSAAGARENFS
jgi:hypothetical protein